MAAQPTTASVAPRPAAWPELSSPTRAAGARWSLRLYVTIAGALTAVSTVAPSLWPKGNAPPRSHMVLDRVFGNWLLWDGTWYLQIAEHGYSYRPNHQSTVAFFPLYPVLVRVLGAALPGGVPLAAVLTTIVSGAAVLVLFHRWCAGRLSPSAARTATILLAVYPYAWFLYGAAYSDALFVALVLGAFVLVERDRPLWAGVVGAFATATRPTGVALLIGLVAVTLHRRGAFRSGFVQRLRPKDLGVLVAAAGLAVWCAYLALRFKNPLAFVETEGAQGWDQAPGLHTWMKHWFFWHLSHDGWTDSLKLVVQALACVGFLAAVPAVWKRFGWGYGAYVLAAVLLPTMSTSDFNGAGRYLLAAFPVFAIVGGAIDPRPLLRRAVPFVSAIGLVFGTSLFASGYLLT